MTHVMKRFVLIESPVNQVWSSLTEPARLSKWLCRKADVRLEPGGNFHLESTVPHASGKHRVRMVEPERLLKLEWMIHSHPTEVSLLLQNFQGGSRV